MDHTEALAFARHWINAWNTRDLEAVLSHFADDVTFTSPVAAQLIPTSAGVIHGKPALRAYWTTALAHTPTLNFTLIGVYTGINTVIINYRSHRGLSCEALTFTGPLITQGAGTYLIS